MARGVIVLALFAVAAPPAGAQQSPAPARITVRLPADARLFLDDTPAGQRGESRTFETPPLELGYDYGYALRAEVVRDGRPVRAEKKVTFRAGANVTVDLTAELGPPGAPKATAAGELSRDEQEVLDLTNRERQNAGLPPLKHSAKLARAARAHSENMARQGRLDHVLDGKGPTERLAEAGYTSFGWGENVAAGQRTPAEALASWLQSPGHRGNILNGNYTEIGVGIAGAPGGGLYFTQVFARPAN